MDLSNLKPAKGSRQSDNFRRGRGHGSGTAKQPEKAIRVRKRVPERRDRDLKAARCHYTDEFRREALRTEIQRKSLVSI